MQIPGVPFLGMGRLLLTTNHLISRHNHLAECVVSMAALELRVVDDIPLTLVPISCTTMRDGGGVASVAAAPVGQFWQAERAPTASPPLSVTVLMGGAFLVEAAWHYCHAQSPWFD